MVTLNPTGETHSSPNVSSRYTHAIQPSATSTPSSARPWSQPRNTYAKPVRNTPTANLYAVPKRSPVFSHSTPKIGEKMRMKIELKFCTPPAGREKPHESRFTELAANAVSTEPICRYSIQNTTAAMNSPT